MLFLKLIVIRKRACLCMKYICVLSLHAIKPTSTLDISIFIYFYGNKFQSQVQVVHSLYVCV